MKKNKYQILPLAVLLIILTISFSTLSAAGAGKGSFSQTTSNGKSLPSPVADSAEDEQVICSDKFIVCGDEDDGSFPNNNIGEGDHPLSSSSPIIKILKETCKDHGDYCWKDLMAICQVEGCRSEAIGDQGRSYGFFQIQIRLHKITKECAQDISCSAQWTLTNMEKHGYPVYRTYSIVRHNGSGKQAQLYALKVKNIADKL